ncbi:MAG TPA: esterase-like activity of phytase family protein [Vicinamibacteria bacterium]|nr:esterase-like activity of phytase family protein [Vicinamibacteria bacterium]
MRGRPRRMLALLALLAATLAVAVAFSSRASIPPAPAALALEAVPVPLDETDPARDGVGPLRYLGGLWLRSSDPRFGGLSDLRVSADGSRLFAISDCGEGLTAALSYDGAGRLVSAGGAQVAPLASPGPGQPAGGSDAESLVLGEGLEVGFEGRARILAYRVDPPFGGPPRPLPFPEAVGRCGRNGGLETMADVGEGRRLLVCEKDRSASSSVAAFVGQGTSWTERDYSLAFDGGWGGEPFRPTGAARLPDGDLLVLERRFPPIAARIVRLARTSLEGTGPLAPHEIARFEAPLTLDNFEGIEARRDARGRTLVYLLSDDNNCAKNTVAPNLQRTLLLMFAFEG